MVTALITTTPALIEEGIGVFVFGMVGIFCVMAVIFCSVKVLGSIGKKKEKEEAAKKDEK
jgi:Na+-transporting methylmalonyl-CoA/oxaloacetate decarboxylase gamma subunit